MQGDLVDRVPVFVPTTDGVDEAPALVLVVSHSCEFTKTESKPDYPILVAPVVRLDELDGSLRGMVRHDDVTRYWPLPKERIDESAVDLGLVQPVLRQDLLGGERLFSCPDDGRIALADRLFSMISLRERPVEE